ncbi:hypothetical protein ACPF0Q_000648 [Vibrio cholerae]|uniref:hypothetical protein n=1 Tax=Vibrio cholerae TaxID=666 RepID=UPI0013727DC3|nr:hypothetical protein [Vibrio cholerae]NAR20232.1 hypothetical protein [Vibrio cholerae]NAR31694.1 hypothetical protein [Vibrio cholerae]
MDGVDLLNQISSFIETYNFVSNDGDDYICQVEMTDEMKKKLSDWESDGLILTIKDLTNDRELDVVYTVVGNNYEITLSLVIFRQDGINIYASWSQFFDFNDNQSITPDSFYIISDRSKYIGQTEGLTGDLKNYLNTVTLVNILIELSDHFESGNGLNVPNIVMLHKNRLEIPCKYKIDDIRSGLDGITHINNWINDNAHKDQKVSIFKTALYDFLKSVQREKRFEYLLLHFGEFTSQVTENYELYVSEFSFDDVRLEYQEKKRDYMLKINETFSSIQTKALGIPVSIAAIAMRLSTSKLDGFDKATNTLLFLAASVYGLMMLLLIQNQKHSLTSIEVEYKGQINRLKKEYPEHHDKISVEFKDLDSRCRMQRFQLNVFLFFVFVLIAISYMYLEVPFRLYWIQMHELLSNSVTLGWEILIAFVGA